MTGVLFIIAAILFVVYILLHRSADKQEEKFANRPTIITNPATDLFTNEKYAIVKLLAFVQGASSASAFDDEANKIVQSTIFTLGLSQGEVEKLLKISMNHSPEVEMRRIFDSLNEIRDKNFLRELYHKCDTVANISGDNDTIEMVRDIFESLNVL